MSNDTKDEDQVTSPEDDSAELPAQESPQDTSNWDDRPFDTPGGRVVIETYQGDKNEKTIAE